MKKNFFTKNFSVFSFSRNVFKLNLSNLSLINYLIHLLLSLMFTLIWRSGTKLEVTWAPGSHGDRWANSRELTSVEESFAGEIQLYHGAAGQGRPALQDNGRKRPTSMGWVSEKEKLTG